MAQSGMAGRFAGRVGFVTGAASGLGRATAAGLARDGARLLLFDRDAAGLAETAALCPGALCVTGDVTSAADLDAAARAAADSVRSRCWSPPPACSARRSRPRR